MSRLPKTKTFFDLADQMSRSGRSGGKNIVEGWKRNTTKEYFDFLGFSIGAVEELKDDAADIATGVYPQLLGVKGVMRREIIGRKELDKMRFYPLPQNLDAAAELFLRAKEVNYLLYKLQQSLDVKMDREHSKPLAQKAREHFTADREADESFNEYLKTLGLTKLPNGMFIESNTEKKGEEEE